MQKLTVSPSPHIHSDVSTRTLMRDVVIALMPATLVAIVFYGWRELLVVAVSVGCCVLLEWLITRFMLKKESTIGDMSAVVTGLLLALNLPSLTPLWVVAIGALIAIGVAKMSFGGIGQNLFNPALVARVFLLISFPVYMTTWPVVDLASAWNLSVDATTGPTILGMLNAGVSEAALPEGAFGLINGMGGSAGELSAAALILGFIYLLIRRVIKPWITLSIWGTVAIFAAIAHLVSPETCPGVLTALFSGGLMLGSIFMATDYVTSPMTDRGGIVFGIGIGILTMVIRYWGAYPEGVSFAILIMNATVPLINKCFKSKKFA